MFLGNLTDCYDELGNRYQLPVYLLSNPINFIDESSSAIEGQDTFLADLANMKAEDLGKEVDYRIRISSKHEDFFDITLREKSYVYHGKLAVYKQFKIDVRGQRWFYGGKVLLDTVKLKDYKIASECIIQVIDITKKEESLAKEDKSLVTIEINNMQGGAVGESKEGADEEKGELSNDVTGVAKDVINDVNKGNDDDVSSDVNKSNDDVSTDVTKVNNEVRSDAIANAAGDVRGHDAVMSMTEMMTPSAGTVVQTSAIGQDASHVTETSNVDR